MTSLTRSDLMNFLPVAKDYESKDRLKEAKSALLRKRTLGLGKYSITDMIRQIEH